MLWTYPYRMYDYRMTEMPTTNPEKEKSIDDNDRKFTLGTIDPRFLDGHGAHSYVLVTDWLETNEKDETKVACKKFQDGKVETLLITKTTVDGKRVAKKTEISEEDYRKYLEHAKVHVEKIRHEFSFIQDGVPFAIKYDEFIDSELRVLEVGSAAPADTESFKPENFPFTLKEVSDDKSFVGFRVVAHI